VDGEKEIRWIGSAYDDLLAFPKDPRKEAAIAAARYRAVVDARKAKK